jgi:hypothetical protein
VTRGEAHPLWSISKPMHLPMSVFQRLGVFSTPHHERLSALWHGDTLWIRQARLMPTPRATWLEEPLSVDSDLSHPLSFSQTPPCRVRSRTAASCAVVSACADHGEFYLREPSPHLRTRIRRQQAWAGRVPSCRAMKRAFTLSTEAKALAVTPSSFASRTRS